MCVRIPDGKESIMCVCVCVCVRISDGKESIMYVCVCVRVRVCVRIPVGKGVSCVCVCM